jgi:hypothetical protein
LTTKSLPFRMPAPGVIWSSWPSRVYPHRPVVHVHPAHVELLQVEGEAREILRGAR